MRIAVVFICLLLVSPGKSLAQTAGAHAPPPLRLPTRAFTADDGLGGATITSLLKDARGFLWIGTPDELLLYDGTRFQPFHYTDSAGAPQSFRRAYLYSLGTHGVFIAHEEGTHQFVAPAGRLRAVTTPFDDFYVRSSMRAEGATSAVFRVSTNEHTARYDARACRWLDVQRQPLPHITATSVSPTDKMLLGCDTGASARTVCIRDRAARAPAEVFNLPFRVACVLRLVEGTLFLDAADGQGLWWMPTGGSSQLVARLRWPARDICAAYAGDGLCYLAAGHSLLRFSPLRGRMQEILGVDATPLVRSGVLTHVLPDERTLWVGSNTTGLIRVSLEGPRLRHLRAGSAVLDWSHAIFPDLARGRIYVGGYSGMVAVFDTAEQFIEDLTPTLHHARGIPSAYINAIEPLADGRLFIASGHNLWVYDPATRATINLLQSAEEEKRAHGIDPEDYQGRYGVLRTGPLEWWMTEKIGAIRWRIIPAKNGQPMRMKLLQVLRVSPPSPEAFCSYAGGWWCASAGRLYKFDQTGLRDSFHYPISAFATGLVPDARGRLWISTESGIAVWKDGKVERILTTNDGLPNNHVYALLPDRAGRMWGSTNGGLFAMRMDESSVRAFTGGDGLQGAEFNLGAAATDARGRLYFGGMNGVNIVEPSVALREGVASPVTITRVAGADTLYHTYPGAATPPSLRLPYDRASLTISFTAPQLEAAGPLRFEYRLRADDSVWTDNGTRHELQLLLAPGNYRVELRVQGASATVAAFSVEVTPPFYRAWWFIVLLVAGTGAFVAAAIIGGARRRYQRQLSTLETARRIQEEKSRISRELHDELGARAALMAHNASLLREEAGESNPLVPLAVRVSEATADMLTALRETVWTLKQEAITVESLWLRYKNFIAKLAATYGHIHFVVEEDEWLPTEPLDYARALHLLRILQEAVINAAKHSGASTITSSARLPSGRVCLSVMDDGRGFDVEVERARGEGNGLYNMQHRASEAGLRLNIRAGGKRGMVVEVGV